MSDKTVSTTRVVEVSATFADSDSMQQAVSRLALNGFDRADISLPAQEAGTDLGEAARPAMTDADSRQARTLGSSTAAAAAAIAAAGVTIATGGAAAPAVAAAVVAGGAAGGATYAASGVATGAEQQRRDAQAAQGALTLVVRARTGTKREQATAIMRAANAISIEFIEWEQL